VGLHEIDGADDDLAGQTLSTPFWGGRDVMARFLDFENYAWNFEDSRRWASVQGCLYAYTGGPS